MSDPIVTRLSVATVKGTRLQCVESVALGPGGAEGDRRFFVVDARDRMLNGKQLGELQQVVASESGDALSLVLPSGECVKEVVRLGDAVRARFYSRMREGRLVHGPFAGALSELCGQPVRLVADRSGAVDRGAAGGVSLVSCASLARLADQAQVSQIDSRRFRMTVEVDGLNAHEEDGWVGATVQIGEARVRFAGHVGRCLITSRDPDSGEIDLPTLDLLREYRDEVQSTEPLPFGISGAVQSPGLVRVGDAVTRGAIALA